MSLYVPNCDTYLLEEVVLDYALRWECMGLKICEVGVGSGHILKKLIEKLSDNYFYATDVDERAVLKLPKIVEGGVGNLLEPFCNLKFDLIYFNAPYLPCEKDFDVKDEAIYGGVFGYEIAVEFLEQVKVSLKSCGVCFLLISTLTQPKVVEQKLLNLGFTFLVVRTKKLFFEELLVYEIRRGKI